MADLTHMMSFGAHIPGFLYALTLPYHYQEQLAAGHPTEQICNPRSIRQINMYGGLVWMMGT